MSNGAFVERADIVLASASPRRKELLGSLGIAYRVIPSLVDEPDPDPAETPGGYALRMARLKARDVAWGHPGSYVLGADTVVAVGGHILGKPRDQADSRRMTAMLAGREHTVVTGCCLIGPGGAALWEEAVSSRVTFARLTEEAIAAYAATKEPMDKAGGYAIQGLGAFMIERIEGSYTSVVGLPLAEVVAVLAAHKAIAARGV
ncbi:Septum formation protein Maf [Fundidesulfovibrio magnetotacticus]|uniref:dTTP/UTP pyrophosphatase n=1 Tax=Fundidesulfovibrio magnetotacticus TaxID=2730080 RepID=A0A6V8LSI2_9BACT|nr:Maf family protein [Fundidesulfovibrio magnetotacticus]GFK92746.1 Septum formation protein Maf [Fundidesulfovibrio magnetotacticus]